VPFPLTLFDWYCHLYFQCLLHQIFLAAVSSKLFSSPQHAHITFFVQHDKLELAFWLLCSLHAVIQLPADGVGGSRRVLVEGLQNKLEYNGIQVEGVVND